MDTNWPMTTKIWKNSCRMKPSTAPMRICSAISSIMRRLSASTSGIGGRLGDSSRVMASARYRRTRRGTRLPPNTGMTISKAPMRNSGSRKALTQPPICASVSSSTRSTDYVGDVVHQRLGELQPLAHQPGTGPHQGGQHHQQARQEAQGLLVDLRGGLDHRHHQTGEQAGPHEDGHRHGGEPQGVAKQINGDFRGHGYNVPKLAARVPMIRLQPSMSTNSMTLNGSEMISGESIIIPMAMRILATTRSMIRNGMK